MATEAQIAAARVNAQRAHEATRRLWADPQWAEAKRERQRRRQAPEPREPEPRPREPQPPTPPEVPDAQPAIALRLALVEARARGRSFDDAWPDALASALRVVDAGRGQWVEALRATEDAWRAGYERSGRDTRCFSILAHADL